MSVNLNRCDLVDSITRALQSRIESINEFERTTLGMSSVRCDRNWPEGVRLQRRRLELQPHSAVVKWTAAMTHSLANRQEEAVELFAQINPLRDLAWLGQGRGNYYMSEASAHHLLGDYGAEQEVGRKAAGDVEEKLGPTFIMVRSAAGRGDTVALLSALSGLSAPGPPPPPTFLAANRLDDWIPSIHWVRAQAAAELAAHGHEGEARRVAIEGVTLLRASSDDSTAAVNQYALARMLLVADSAAAAKAVFAGLVAADSANIRFQGFLGAAAARSGDSATAGAILAWLAQHQGTRPPGLTQYYVAAIETNRGNRSLALDLIEKLPYGSHPNDVMEFHVDPMLAPLRAEARFQRFIRPR
jgi:hypothetical protein